MNEQEQPPVLMGKPKKKSETWRLGSYEITRNEDDHIVSVYKWHDEGGPDSTRHTVSSGGSIGRTIKEITELRDFLEWLRRNPA